MPLPRAPAWISNGRKPPARAAGGGDGLGLAGGSGCCGGNGGGTDGCGEGSRGVGECGGDGGSLGGHGGARGDPMGGGRAHARHGEGRAIGLAPMSRAAVLMAAMRTVTLRQVSELYHGTGPVYYYHL